MRNRSWMRAALPASRAAKPSRGPACRPGHIAGSFNIPYTEFTEADGTFKSPERLARLFADTRRRYRETQRHHLRLRHHRRDRTARLDGWRTRKRRRSMTAPGRNGVRASKCRSKSHDEETRAAFPTVVTFLEADDAPACASAAAAERQGRDREGGTSAGAFLSLPLRRGRPGV